MTESISPAPTPRPQRRRPRGAATEYRHRNWAVYVPEGHMAIGRIVGVHGLDGELRVELHTDYPERFASDAEVLLGQKLRAYVIERAREHKGMILLMLADVTDRAQAEELRDEWIFIPDDKAMPLPEGDYWLHDIIGLTVTDEDGRILGRIIDILQTGANDVYILAPETGINQDKELLIPAIAEVIQQVDLPNRTMTIRLIPGLLDK